MRDRRPRAVRAQRCRGAPTAVALWTSGPDPAAPGVEDATPGHPILVSLSRDRVSSFAYVP
eukprot:4559636-Prymnesium_polylepis.1